MDRPRVSLAQWHTLQTVIDCGSFAAAADYLHRSQSSVSYAIQTLQRQLGMALLRQEGRKAHLTESGALMLQRVRHLLEDASRLEAFAHSLESGWEAEITLVVDAAFPIERVMQALGCFTHEGHGTRVQLREEVMSGVTQAVQDGGADVAIGYEVPAGLLCDPLLEVKFLAVAHAEHPLLRLGRPLSPQDLVQQLQIVIRDTGTRAPENRGWLDTEHRWTLSSMDAAITAIESGLGFGWLPEHRVQPYLDSNRLQLLPLAAGAVYRVTLYLIVAHAETAGPATRRLAELTAQAVSPP